MSARKQIRAEDIVSTGGHPNDIRQAEYYLKADAPPVIPGDDSFSDDSIQMICDRFYAFGISRLAALDLLRVYSPEYDRDELKATVFAAFENQFDVGGQESLADSVFVEPPTHFKMKGDTNKPLATDPDNIAVALAKMGVTLTFDMFDHKARIKGLEGFGPIIQDDAVRDLRFQFHARFGLFPTKDLTHEAIMREARRNAFNSASDFFDCVEPTWDGVPRLDTFLIDYAGARDTPFVRAVGALPWIAAVRRVRSPGAKFDEMLVLESEQGKNKSSAMALMAIKPEWFTDSMSLGADGRMTQEQHQGKLIIECAELQGMRKGDIDKIKAMLSSQYDRGRPAYGKLQEEWPRQCVHIGTVNGKNYLKDPTGNRRFWPVAIREFDLQRLTPDRDQIWAEAATRESRGESIRLDQSLWASAAVEQEARSEVVTDPITAALRDRLGDMTGKISSESVWRLVGMDKAAQRSQELNKRVGGAMKFLGWKYQSVRINGEKKQGYIKGTGRDLIIVTRIGDDPTALYEHNFDDDEFEG